MGNGTSASPLEVPQDDRDNSRVDAVAGVLARVDSDEIALDGLDEEGGGVVRRLRGDAPEARPPRGKTTDGPSFGGLKWELLPAHPPS